MIRDEKDRFISKNVCKLYANKKSTYKFYFVSA